MEIVAADGVESGLARLNDDLLPAGEAAEAVPVGHHHGAAALDQLGKLRVVHLGAHQGHSGPEGEFRLRLTGLQLLQGLLQIGQDQVMGADLAHQLDHMELIAGDGRVWQLAVIADLGDDAGDLVVILDGLFHGLLGHVHSQLIPQLVHHLQLKLGLVVLQVVLVALHGRVDDGGEELLVLHRVNQDKVLLHPFHGRAALRAEQGLQIVVAALDGPLQDGTDVGTVSGGHVVAGDVGGDAAGRPQPAGKAAGQVQQGLRYVIAVVAQGMHALAYRLCDQLVVRFLKQILKVDQML